MIDVGACPIDVDGPAAIGALAVPGRRRVHERVHAICMKPMLASEVAPELRIHGRVRAN